MGGIWRWEDGCTRLYVIKGIAVVYGGTQWTYEMTEFRGWEVDFPVILTLSLGPNELPGRIRR